MLIHYLKRDWNAKKGQIKEVPDKAARVLIDIGRAEKAPKKGGKKGGKKAKEDVAIQQEEKTGE